MGSDAPVAPGARPEPVIDLTDGWLRRVRVDGRHLALGGVPYRVRGATYGTFVPRADGERYPETAQVKDDFDAMAGMGLGVVRTYTLPPPDVLDVAADRGLRLLVGLDHHDWRMERDIGRRGRRRILDAGRREIERALDVCADNPTILGVAVGNEVPADLVRVHGIAHVEDTLSRLVAALHEGDRDLLTTYVSYPTTEYLEVEGIDFASFNVFLERPDALRRYLQHLQTVAGERPVVITELGLASEVHGEDAQADLLRTSLDLVDATGCAGATVFAWTDEWGVGGVPVTGWGFGITDEARVPKPAAAVVERWARRSIADLRPAWPTVSVVVCAYNEERVLRECLDSLLCCDYPALEVIVCDDGSTDTTLDIARRYPFRLLELPHGGLSAARNAGLAAATGEIVAYLDADASCHPEWPFHLALSLEDPDIVATGGPNLPFPSAPFVERTVAASPGGPIEVLIGDTRAEHVPGCNMAFRRDALLDIGGFDTTYTSAGDDVDVCWRLLDIGFAIGFAPAAQIWHHRRPTVRTYLRQQRNYGRSERMVAAKHRHRFNRLGQARWSGFLYGGQRILPSLLRPVVYHGHLGAAPFQSVVHRRAEWALGWAAALLPLAVPLLPLGLLLALVSPIGFAVAGAVLAVVAAYAAAVFVAVRPSRHEPTPVRFRALVAWLHAAQPIVRAWGRLRATRLARGPEVARAPWAGDRLAWLGDIEQRLRAGRAAVRVGDATDDWDLATSRFGLVRCRLTAAVVWSWVPVRRLTYRPTAAALVLAGATSIAARSLVPAVAVAAAGVADGLAARQAMVAASRVEAPVQPAPPVAAERAGVLAEEPVR